MKRKVSGGGDSRKKRGWVGGKGAAKRHSESHCATEAFQREKESVRVRRRDRIGV